MPEIVYFNGRRVAMGEDLEPIVVLDPAKPGERVLIAAKLLQTVDKKHFERAEVRVDFSPARPSPLDLYEPITRFPLVVAPPCGGISIEV